MLEESAREFVIDSSFVLAFLLPDENKEFVDKIFDEFDKGNIVLTSCYLLPFEVLNALSLAVIRKRITKNKATRMLSDFLKLGIGLSMIDFKQAFLLARKHGLSYYDASYYALSLEIKATILSLDRHLMALVKN